MTPADLRSLLASAATDAELSEIAAAGRSGIRLNPTVARLLARVELDRERYAELLASAKAVIKATDAAIDTRSPPLKYTSQWNELVALRAALAKLEKADG